MTSIRDFPVEKIGEATALSLYEGLPHDWVEADLFAEELRTKSAVYLEDYPFYQEVRQLAPGDTEQLTALFLVEEAFTPWTDWKRCGGFHPDFGLEWMVEGETYRALFCFGCDEVLLSTPHDKQKWDIKPTHCNAFHDVLIRYHKHRPIEWRTTAEKERHDRVLKKWYNRPRRRSGNQ